MKHLTHRERIQTYTGLISAAGTLIIGPMMFVYSRGYDYPAIRLNPVFFLLIGLVSGTLFLMSSFRYTEASRRLQIILLWISGCAVAIESTPGNISSFLFLAAGLGLSIEYDMADFRRLSVAGLVGALYLEPVAGHGETLPAGGHTKPFTCRLTASAISRHELQFERR